jgi:AcrR family transcriptional regulator
VSTPNELPGRANQKRRTRNDLIAAARELIAQGGSSPTIDEAAARAGVSRTTAYRYFPSQRALLVAAHPEIQVGTILPADIGEDPEARLMAAVNTFTRLIVETEQQQRTMLRLSLDSRAGSPDLPLRKGRAIGWFEEALEPLRGELGDGGVHQLALAIRSAVGIESLVWLTDVAGLSRHEAIDLMRWSARALLHAAATDRPPHPAANT